VTVARARYSAELRAAIGRLLVGRATVSLVAIERDLPAEFAGEVPSRVTLGKHVVALGWTKVQRPGSGATYRAPRP